MEELNLVIRKAALWRGLIFGGLMLVVDVLKQYYLANWAQSPIATFVILYPFYYIIVFVTAIGLINNLRSHIGGYWALKQAITGIFIFLFVASFIWNNGITLFSTLINPSLAAKAHTGFVNSRRAAMLSQHLPAAKVNHEVAQMNQTFAMGGRLTAGGFFRSLLISIVLIFAVSALLGALFKREKPANQSVVT